MSQISFSEFEYSHKKRQTKRELFLAKMEKVIPFVKWCDLIRPFYYEYGNGRRPVALEVILKMYFVSNWFCMSDEATEDSLYDSMAIKKFVGGTADATTLCKFRKMLEVNKLTERLFNMQNEIFMKQGLIMHEGTIVDATVIESPKKTEGGVTYKNNQRYYGTKAHIGVDKKTGFIHSVAVTTANESDVATAAKVLHGAEQEVYGDAGYVGIERREDICTKYNDGTGEVELVTYHSHNKRNYYVCKKRPINFYICSKQNRISDFQKQRQISNIRKKVEHAFCKLKCFFGYRRTRYRTLAKNASHIYTMFTLVNLVKVV